jgi:hypothetical protein
MLWTPNLKAYLAKFNWNSGLLKTAPRPYQMGHIKGAAISITGGEYSPGLDIKTIGLSLVPE